MYDAAKIASECSQCKAEACNVPRVLRARLRTLVEKVQEHEKNAAPFNEANEFVVAMAGAAKHCSKSDEHVAEWGSADKPLPFAVPELPVWDRCFTCVRLLNAGIQRRCPKHQNLPGDPLTTKESADPILQHQKMIDPGELVIGGPPFRGGDSAPIPDPEVVMTIVPTNKALPVDPVSEE